MFRISVSMGVLFIRRMKKSWDMREAGTARRAGSRSSRRSKRCGWDGYWVRIYSVRVICVFFCRFFTCAGFERL